MKRFIFSLATVMLLNVSFVSCSNDDESNVPEQPQEEISEYVDAMKAFKWVKASVVNGKYTCLSSYENDDDFLTENTGGIVMFTDPSINPDSPTGTYRIMSFKLTSCKQGFPWFEIVSENDNENVGSVTIEKSAEGHWMVAKVNRMVDEKKAVVKNAEFTFNGKIEKSDMLEY